MRDRAKSRRRSGHTQETRSPDPGDIRREVEPIIEQEGFELLEMVYVGSRSNAILRLVLDHPEKNVTLDDCSRMSGVVGRLLDGLDLIPRRYRLEVSTPGVNRLLSRDRDFVRFQGSRIQVSIHAPQGDDPEYALEPRRTFTGQLVAYDMAEGVLSLETEAGLLRIPRAWINRASLSPELPMPRKQKRNRRP